MDAKTCSDLASTGGAVLTLATCGADLALTGGAVAVATLTVPALIERFRKGKDSPAKIVREVAKQIEADMGEVARSGEFTKESLVPAQTAAKALLPITEINAEAVAAADEDDKALVALLLAAAATTRNHYKPGPDPQIAVNIRYLEIALLKTLVRFRALPDFQRQLQESYRRDGYEFRRLTGEKLDSLADGQADLKAKATDIELMLAQVLES